ncbi:hypothetical protein BN85412400 [Alteracholeplasma palmae J233]|uniref:Uncharacterized protein n=1 Tax=Alteracholeplasma palmae (strain ATCC 49389 / J233) TaxID=1318466 RepID=U4KLP5_ALTPJ|nr:hypothetical protein BN85412400 [Alteracholeplasma palmae J233]
MVPILIFVREITLWFLISVFANIINFFILTLLEKTPEKITNKKMLINILIRNSINIVVLLLILLINRNNQTLLLKSYIASAVGFLSIKVGIYIYKAFYREKEGLVI